MAESDEQAIRLLLEVTDSGSVGEAVGKLLKLKDVTQSVADTYSIADQRGDQFVVTTKNISHALDAEVAKAVEATMAQKAMNQMFEEGAMKGGQFASVAHTIGAGGQAVAAGTGNAGRGILGMQYAVDDFMAVYQNQGFGRAIAAMQNNIPQIALSFGGTAGLTAAIGFFSLAAGAAIPLVQKFMNSLGDDTLAKAKEDLEKLAKKADEFNAMLGKPTRAEAAGGKIISEAVIEGDPAKIARAAARALTASGRGAGMTEDEAQQLKDPLTAQMFGGQEELKKKIQQRREAADLKSIQNAMVDLGAPGEAGRKARGLLRPLVDANPKAFPPGFLSDIERAEPAAVKQQQEWEAQGEVNAENIVRNSRLKEAAAKKQEADEKDAARMNDKMNRDAQKAEDAEAGDRGKLMKQFTHAAKAERTDNERRAKDAERVQKQRQRAAEVKQFHQATEQIEDARVKLEEGYKNELNFAKLTGATAQMVNGVHQRHALLKNQIDAQERMARRMHQRTQESMMQGNDG